MRDREHGMEMLRGGGNFERGNFYRIGEFRDLESWGK